MFNIKKYKNKKFSDNQNLNEKIKALYLLFDKKVDDLNMGQSEIINTLNMWIQIFIKKEEYELANAFKQRKIMEWRKNRKLKRLFSIKLFYRIWRFRLRKLFIKILSNV